MGDPAAAWCHEHSFVTGPPVGGAAFPVRLGVVGDVGLTYNSTDTINHLVAHEPEMVIFTGGAWARAENPNPPHLQKPYLQMPSNFPEAVHLA